MRSPQLPSWRRGRGSASDGAWALLGCGLVGGCAATARSDTTALGLSRAGAVGLSMARWARARSRASSASHGVGVTGASSARAPRMRSTMVGAGLASASTLAMRRPETPSLAPSSACVSPARTRSASRSAPRIPDPWFQAARRDGMARQWRGAGRCLICLHAGDPRTGTRLSSATTTGPSRSPSRRPSPRSPLPHRRTGPTVGWRRRSRTMGTSGRWRQAGGPS